MATNIKKRKKKATYDNKSIIWIASGLATLVAAIILGFIIVSISGSYVAKAGSEKIYTYDFAYFLKQEIYNEYNAEFENFEGKPEDYDSLPDDEKNYIIDQFFDEARKEKIKNAALEEARKFKAEYAIAVKNGYKLTSQQKTNVKANIDYYYNYYLSMGLSDEMAKYYITGGTGMTLSEYKKWTIEQATVENYKAALKEGYTVSDEEIRETYEEEPNDYRTLTGRVYKFDIPTVPTDENNEAIKPDTENKSDQVKYQDYLTKLDNYVKVAEQMKAAFDAGEKYTLYDYDYVTLTPNKVKDDENKETDEDKVVIKDATFEELCTSGGTKWTSASSNKGVISVNNNKSSGVKEIDEYVLRVEWNSDRTGFVVTAKTEEPVDTENTENTEDTDSASSSSTDGAEKAEGDGSDDEKEEEKVETKTVTPSEIEIIKVNNEDGTLKELYLVRVENIEDIDTEPEEGAEMNTIQSSLKTQILEDKAVAELEDKVAAAGSKYALKGLKKKNIEKIMKENF